MINGHRHCYKEILKKASENKIEDIDSTNDLYQLGLHLYHDHGLTDPDAFDRHMKFGILDVVNPKDIMKKEFKWMHKLNTFQPIGINTEYPFGIPYINIDARAIAHAEYKALKNRITSLIYSSKKEYYSKYFDEYSNNIRKVWIGIKGIINIKTKDQNSPNCIEVNNELITDNNKIPDEFNNYFSTVADNILKENKTPILKLSINI